MDTVTESRLAIAMAQAIGVGCNPQESACEDQAREVSRVKRFESGVLKAIPLRWHQMRSVRDVVASHPTTRYLACLYSGQTPLIGIVNRDLRFEGNLINR